MGGGGGQETQTVESKSEPPAFVRPFSERLLNRSEALSTGFTPDLATGAESLVGFTPRERLAFDLTANRALFGSPEVRAAQGAVANLANPELAFSPLADRLVNSAQSNIIDRFNEDVSGFVGLPGRRGNVIDLNNTGMQEVLARRGVSLGETLGRTEDQIRSGFFDRALGAAGLAPGLAEVDFRNLAALEAVGAQERGLNQLVRDVDVARRQRLGNLPLERLGILSSAINVAGGGFGNTFQQSTGPAGFRPNPFIGALGGAGSFLGGVGGLLGSGVFG